MMAMVIPEFIAEPVEEQNLLVLMIIAVVLLQYIKDHQVHLTTLIDLPHQEEAVILLVAGLREAQAAVAEVRDLQPEVLQVELPEVDEADVNT